MNYPVWGMSDTVSGWVMILAHSIFTLTTLSAFGIGAYTAFLVKYSGLNNADGYREFIASLSRTALSVLTVAGPLALLGMWLVHILHSPDTLTTIVFEFIWVWILQALAYILEIATLFVLVRSLEKGDVAIQSELSWSLAILGLITLFVANATLSFQQTPGFWLETGNFEDAWFNTSYLASLFLRLLVSVSAAGVWAFVALSVLPASQTKRALGEFSASFVIYPFLLMPVALFWYLNTIDPVVAGKLTDGFTGFASDNHSFLSRLVLGAVFGSVALFLFAFLGGILNTDGFKRSMAFWMVLLALSVSAVSEYSRMLIGNPYAIAGYSYNNSIRLSQADDLNTGFLEKARWTVHKSVTDENLLAAGKELYDLQFRSGIPSGFNELTTFCQGKTYQEILDFIKIIRWGSENNIYQSNLPSFIGTDREAEALAAWIAYSQNSFEASQAQIDWLNRYLAAPGSVLTASN
ncbi:MAG: hypothetical protein HUU10_08970 [Bacteroidetes bacterium]|nr:hypothetical protein [Bacteroidota bacterium]